SKKIGYPTKGWPSPNAKSLRPIRGSGKNGVMIRVFDMGQIGRMNLMIDEIEMTQRIGRNPGAASRIGQTHDYTVQTGSEDSFEKQWHEFAAIQSQRSGCVFLRLQRDTEKPSHYVTYNLWKARCSLVDAIRATPEEPTYPITGEPHLTYMRT